MRRCGGPALPRVVLFGSLFLFIDLFLGGTNYELQFFSDADLIHQESNDNYITLHY